MPDLYWNTVNDLLTDLLQKTISSALFEDFRLVGGTSLSLQLGHRISIDIDLFTDALYGSIDFVAIDTYFREHYHYVDTGGGPVAMGRSYFLGSNETEAVKIDLYYTDDFIRPVFHAGAFRLASFEDIIAMKLEVISNAGRKKDFWDLHELSDHYTISEMLGFHKERYPFHHDENIILKKLIDFREAEDDFDPVCLKGKHWELIKLDFVKLVRPDIQT